MKIYIIIGSLLFLFVPLQAHPFPHKAIKNKGVKKMAIEDTVEYPLALFPSYLKMIKNSKGSRIYRNLYFKIKGKTCEVLENGNLSCAYYIASILKHFDLIKEFRTSVDGLVEEMKKHGWVKIKKPKPGSVIVWSKIYFYNSNSWHGHVGFYVGNGWAISNSSKKGKPVKHHWRKEPTSGRWRKIVKILWHPKLN